MTLNSEELFDENLHLAKKITWKMIRLGKNGVEFEDVYQEAIIGLIKASRMYTNEKGMSFERYAFFTIYQEVLRFIMYNQNLLHTSKDVIELAVTINKRKMTDWTAAEIAKELNVKQRRVELAIQHLQRPRPVSVYQPIPGVGDDSTDLQLIDTFRDSSDPYDMSLLDAKRFINSLEPRQKKIIELRLEGLSQLKIAKIIGVSQVHVGRMMKEIKTKYIEYIQIS